MTNYDSLRLMMVDTQVRPSDVTKFPIIDAMLSTPRECFVPDDLKAVAYAEHSLPLSEDRVLLEPRTFAKMLDALFIEPSDVVLDVGCGLGYSSAILAKIAESVVGLEVDEHRAEDAQQRLTEHGIDNTAIVSGPLEEGHARSGPYDVIIVQGAVEHVPMQLQDQLVEGGRIACVFADGELGVVQVGRKVNGKIHWRFVFNANAPVLPGFSKDAIFTL